MDNLWNDLGKKINEAVNYTTKEAGKLADTAKLNYKLMNLKSRMDFVYQCIGKLYYSEMNTPEIEIDAQAKTEDDVLIDKGVRLSELCDEIKEIKEEIKAIQAEIAVKQKKPNICEVCGAELKNDMNFCPKCGTKRSEK